LVYK